MANKRNNVIITKSLLTNYQQANKLKLSQLITQFDINYQQFYAMACPFPSRNICKPNID